MALQAHSKRGCSERSRRRDPRLSYPTQSSSYSSGYRIGSTDAVLLRPATKPINIKWWRPKNNIVHLDPPRGRSVCGHSTPLLPSIIEDSYVRHTSMVP